MAGRREPLPHLRHALGAARQHAADSLGKRVRRIGERQRPLEGGARRVRQRLRQIAQALALRRVAAQHTGGHGPR